MSPGMMKFNPPRFLSGTEARDIPFKMINNLITIPISINGSRPLSIILDTGMPVPGLGLMKTELIEELGLTCSDGPRILLGGAGSGKMSEAKLVKGLTISLPGVEFRDLDVTVSDQPQLIGDGVIGAALFKTCVVEIDYITCNIHLYDPASYQPPSDGVPVELTATPPRMVPSVDAVIQMEAGRSVPLKLVLDLGYSGSVSLYTNPDKGIRIPDPSLETILGTGIQGDVWGHRARIPSLSINQFSFPDILAAFQSGPIATGLGREVLDGVLGSQVLQRFTLVFDYSRNSLHLTPNIRFHEPFELPMTGLILRPDGDGVKIVYHLLDRSPAQEKGLLKGDRITAVNGLPIGMLADQEMEKLFTQAGSTVRLTVQRDDKVFDVELTLRRLI